MADELIKNIQDPEIKKEVKKKGPTDLPPGHKRDEVMRRRADLLAKKIEELSEQMAIGAIDINKLKIDNEIAGRLGSVTDVSNAQQERVYLWVNDRHVHVEKAKNDGWQVVQGSDPEAKEVEAPDGSRRVGDVILAWMPEDLFVQKMAIRRLQTKQRKMSGNQQAEHLIELSYKYGHGNVKVHPEISPEHKRVLDARIRARRAAGQATLQQLESQLRSGNIPGAEIGV